MEKKKYGVSLSSIQGLLDFQRSLKEKRKCMKRVKMPFRGNAWLSMGQGPLQQVSITATPGIVDVMGIIIPLKGFVDHFSYPSIEVIYECILGQLRIVFDNEMARTLCVDTIGYHLGTSSASSSSSDSSGNNTDD